MTSAAATILIVDDEITNCKLLEALLLPEGYLTLSAANGEEALASIAQRAPDLILLDVMMPGMDGYQVASQLKANPATSSIPIIMVTAQIDRSARLAGLNAGAEEFLTIPVDRTELWLRVRNLLRLKALGDVLQNHSSILEQQVQARTESLHDSELRFRQMAENISDVFFLVDANNNRMLYISPAYEAIWGRSCESLYANPESWTEAFHPDDRASTYEKYKQGMAAGKFEHEYRIVRPDGSIRWIEARGFPVFDDAGEIVRVTGVAEDITKRKETEDRIVHLNRVYAMLSGINTLIVHVRDRDELFREACRIAVEEGGFRMAWIGIVDRQAMKIVPVASAAMDEKLLTAIKDLYTLSEGVPLGNTMTARAIREKKAVVSNDSQNDPQRLFGKKYAESGIRSIASLPLIVSDEAVGVLALYASEIEFFHEDEMKLLTELTGDIAFAIDHIEKGEKLAQSKEELRSALSQLLQSEKMASIGQLAAGVAHEINNPIGYVDSNLGSLERYLKDLFNVVDAYESAESSVTDDAARERIEQAKQSADLAFLRQDVYALMGESREGISRVKKIVQDLKDFSRVGAEDEWQWADLHHGLDSTLNIVNNEIKYKAQVVKDYGTLPQIECLPSQLNQVFLNLLVNAAHAIESKGTITLKSGSGHGEAWIEISDSGKGIAPEHIKRIFDPFFTTKPVGKGTGLGLSLSYGIVQKHQGRLEVQSEPGVGSTFRVTLPLARQAGLATPEKAKA